MAITLLKIDIFSIRLNYSGRNNSNFNSFYRGGGRTGAVGAFAPVNFQQRVHCTRPDEELSYKWPYFSLKMSFLSPKRSFLVRKMWYNFGFLGCGITPLPLKNFMHPSCQVLGAAPGLLLL